MFVGTKRKMENRQYFLEIFLEYESPELVTEHIHSQNIKRELLNRLNDMMESDDMLSNYSVQIKNCTSTYKDD